MRIRTILLGAAGLAALFLAGCVQLLPLDAVITATPTVTGFAPLTVTFDSGASTGAINSRSWNFGDPASGTANTSSLSRTDHTFDDDGTYTVALLVTAGDGTTDLATTQIIVLNPVPVPRLQATPNHGPAPLTVTFDLSGSIDPAGINPAGIVPEPTGSIVSFVLDFGDGTNHSGTGAELGTPIQHTYTTAEIRTATLTVLDNDGASAATSVSVVAEGIIESFAVPGRDPAGLAFDGFSLWLSDWKNGLIYQIRPFDGFVLSTFEAPGDPVTPLNADTEPAGIVPAPDPASPGGLAWGDGALWVASLSDGKIYKVNPHMAPSDPNHILAELENGAFTPFALTFGGGYLWVGDLGTGLIHKVDPTTGFVVSSIDAPGVAPQSINSVGPQGIELVATMGMAWDHGLLWIAVGSTLYKIDPLTGDIVTSIAAPGQAPFGLTYDGRYLWNADQNGTGTGRLYRLSAP